MGEDQTRRAYDTVADDYARLLPDTRAETRLDLAMVEALVDHVRDAGEVLDAGCGAGRLTRYLADRGCTVRGVDLSPGMVAAGRRAHPDLDLQVASLLDLPFADGRFAGALLWYSTIHTPGPGLPPLLAEVVRVVRPGGVLLVGFQAGHGTVDLAASYGRHGHDVELTRWRRTPDEMAALLTAAGTTEVARLVRAPDPQQPWEDDDQAFLLVRRTDDPTPPTPGPATEGDPA
ncbi:class I SAM-dependent methyltransferase [Ornithinimicrobium pekingense]|uniref:Methyltransferase n=1 Tax=Ornithinimicrobium pekingense TaxID=384677 RepID=A0ABQ2FBJ8_9MICO|nr:class I SAM-dependent methyltransferase [Ornithinimicrobium pekingense]GGK71534.1 methyltransferase [Ornithinimicrobium pekingense]